MYPAPIEKWKSTPKAFYVVTLVAITVIWLAPIILLLNTALKSNAQISTEGGASFTLPAPFSIDAFFSSAGGLFAQSEFWWSMGNSLIVVIPSVLFAVCFATLAGYILAKHKFRGRVWIFALFVAGNFVPFQVLTIPVIQLLEDVKIAGWTPYNTPVGLILFHAAFQTGFCVFFMRNFIAALPNELIEAARMEGANEWQVFRLVVLPLITPALAALALLIFTFVWNDYFWSLVIASEGGFKLGPQALADLARGNWANQWNVMAAGSIFVALPPLVLFFFLQRQFVSGLTMGANKG